MSITIQKIETAIDTATNKLKGFEGTRAELIAEIITPLQAKLKQGTDAGLRCNEKRIKAKFKKLAKALAAFDERPSEKAMRLSAGGTCRS